MKSECGGVVRLGWTTGSFADPWDFEELPEEELPERPLALKGDDMPGVEAPNSGAESIGPDAGATTGVAAVA